MFDGLGTKRKRSKVGKTMAKLYSYNFDHGNQEQDILDHVEDITDWDQPEYYSTKEVNND